MTIEPLCTVRAPEGITQQVKQLARRVIEEPYVGKRLELRSAARTLNRLTACPQGSLDPGCDHPSCVCWLADPALAKS